MSRKIFFGTQPDDLQHIISCIKNFDIFINNKFFSRSNITANSEELLPNAQKSYIVIDCVAAVSENTKILQTAAITNTPIHCKILISEKECLCGVFFISEFSIETSSENIPEFSLQLKSSGEYEIK